MFLLIIFIIFLFDILIELNIKWIESPQNFIFEGVDEVLMYHKKKNILLEIWKENMVNFSLGSFKVILAPYSVLFCLTNFKVIFRSLNFQAGMP